MKALWLLLLVGSLPLLPARADLLDSWTFDNAPGLAPPVNGSGPVIGGGWLTSTFNPSYLTDFQGVSGQALALQAGSSLQDNGASLTIHIPTTGYKNVRLTFSTNKSATGFDPDAVWISPNGSQWTRIGTYSPPLNTAWGSVSLNLSGYTALNNDPGARVVIIFYGASYWNGNNRIDNLSVWGEKL